MNPEVAFHGTLNILSFFLCLISLSGWIATILLHPVQKRSGNVKFLFTFCRFGLSWLFWLSLFGLVASVFETVGTWPHWFIGLSTSIVAELSLYGYSQRGGTKPSRESKSIIDITMPILRVVMVGWLGVLMLEPIVSHNEVHEDERIVAILFDASDSMKLSSRGEKDGGLSRTAVAERLLIGNDEPGKGLLSKLAGDYRIQLHQFASSARAIDLEHWRKHVAEGHRVMDAPPSWTASTNMANGLRQLESDLNLDTLSGIILVTDGCDHSEKDLSQVCNRLVQKKIPVNSVLIGNQQPVRDAGVVAVESSQQIFMGDSVGLRANLNIDQYQGQTANVTLLKDGIAIEEKSLAITSNRFRDAVLFRHKPEGVGIHQYSVRINPLPGEENVANNSLDHFISVTKDYIHMLVIDERPRWEYRYLRNLFSGRDRAIYLQSVLLSPDRLAGVGPPQLMRASAKRAFDDCEATALPARPEDWLKFDVIVLGDVSPELLGPDAVTSIEMFVKNRGGSLLVIAGQNHMPHRYAGNPLADLLPVRMELAKDGSAPSPDTAFHFSATRDPMAREILQPGVASIDSLAMAFPSLSWRHPLCEAKTGASVLGYASAEKPGQPDGPIDVPEPPIEQQRRDALLLWQRFGAGKVIQLTFDQTWRLRFGVGDKFHHQFWGQIVRWSVQERLSAGNDLVRLGTDRVHYNADDPVMVRARLMDTEGNTVVDDQVQALVYDGDQIIRQLTLTVQPDRGGLLQGEIRDLKKSGKYRIELAGETIERLLVAPMKPKQKVFTEIVVQSVNSSGETADLASDSTVPTRLASWTGGKVVTPDQMEELLPTLGPKSTFERRRSSLPLWNLVPVMLVFLGCLNFEWILRRNRGLV